MDLMPSETAVIGVHYIEDVVGETGAFHEFFGQGVRLRGVVPAAKELLDAARSARCPIFLLRVAFRPHYVDLVANGPMLGMVAQLGALQQDTPGTRIVPDLGAQPDDVIVEHRRLGGFQGSELDGLLRARGIKTVLIAGVATNISVEGTARQALDLGYRTILVEDACSAADDQAHQASLSTLGLIGEVARVADVRSALAAT